MNHKYHFVDPETGVHTQTVERLWGSLKWRNKRERGTKRDFLETYLAEFMVRQCLMGDHPFRWILKHIGIFYEPEIAVIFKEACENADVEVERGDVAELDSD